MPTQFALNGEALIRQILGSLLKDYEKTRETVESIQSFQARMEKQVRSDYSNIPHEDFAKKYAEHGTKLIVKSKPVSKNPIRK